MVKVYCYCHDILLLIFSVMMFFVWRAPVLPLFPQNAHQGETYVHSFHTSVNNPAT